jgi:hypothetical protein
MGHVDVTGLPRLTGRTPMHVGETLPKEFAIANGT